MTLAQEQPIIPVNDLTRYNDAMRKSLIDKLYFLDKVDAQAFFDYGCANGALMAAANELFPEYCYFGYDENECMIDLCRSLPFFSATSSLHRFVEWAGGDRVATKNKCLVLSSVVHEVYSYHRDTVKEFWNWVYCETPFQYIAIRDMCVSRSTSRPSDPISVAKVRTRFDREKISQWEAQWGSLYENWSLVHFLLTYRYTEGWDREMRENYLPVNLEEMLSLVPKGWEPTYIEHYTLPFLRQEVLKDFGVDLQDRTHLKLILKRTNP